MYHISMGLERTEVLGLKLLGMWKVRTFHFTPGIRR